MATMKERPEGMRQAPPQLAPPITETAEIEAAHAIIRVKDAISKAMIIKSNQQVAALIGSTLKSCLKLAKTSYGSVAKWPAAFKSLKRIAGGILGG